MGNRKNRRGIYLLVASCIFLGGLPPAQAAPPRLQEPRPFNDATKIRALAEKQLEELGIPDRFMPFLDDAPGVETGRSLFGEPGPDLAGSNAPEVLETDLRYSYTVDESNQDLPAVSAEVDTRITIRNGTNGRELWKKRFDKDAWPIPMRLGESGRHGIVVISGLWSFFGTSDESTMGLHAFDGRNGKSLWSREYKSVSYQNLLVSVTEDAPLIVGILDSIEGKAEDLMVGLATTASTMLTQTMAVRVVMVDGRSGAETIHPLVDVGVDWWPIPLPTNDLDGDGLDDYATTNRLGVDLGQGQDPPEFGGTVYTRKGTDGTPIWTTSGIEMEIFAFTTKLPHVVADRTPDVGLQTYVQRALELVDAPIPLPLPLPTGFRFKDRVYLFDGNDGALRWHKPSEWIYSPGDIDGDGTSDVMLGSFRVSFKKGRTVLEQLALRGDGRRIWKRRSVWRFETMPCPEDLCFGGWGYYPDASPDLQPDRVRDLLFWQMVQQNEAFTDEVTRAYNGRTGKMIFQTEDPLQTVGVAIDGRGTDLLGYKHNGNRVKVSTRNGVNRTLWEGELVSSERILPRRFGFYGMGFKLPGDKCGDLVVSGYEDPESFYGVFEGADGRMRWSRSTAPKGKRLRWQMGRDLNRAC